MSSIQGLGMSGMFAPQGAMSTSRRPPPPRSETTGAMLPPGPPMGGPPGPDPVDALDTDGDGLVTESEFGLGESVSAEMKALFAAMDSDSDGSLTTEERHAFRDKIVAAMESSGEGGAMLAPPTSREESSSFVERLAQVYATLFEATDTAESSERLDIVV